MPSICGFDAGNYPGDAAVTAWAGGGSPFQFMGFYLEAPCHTTAFTPYQGKYTFLKSLGWGLAIIYFGRQQEGCNSDTISQTNGTADGADAIGKCQAEGFPPGAVVYLDIEPFAPPVSPAMQDYVGAWIDALLADGTYLPGIYCHAKNAIDLHLLGEQRYAAAGRPSGAPSFWITGKVETAPLFDVNSSAPADCGIPFADIWQGQIDVGGTTFAGGTIDPLDLNVAGSANPSNT